MNLPACSAIFALCALECIAMLTGNDGVYFLPIVAIISGLGGYKIGEHTGAKRR